MEKPTTSSLAYGSGLEVVPSSCAFSRAWVMWYLSHLIPRVSTPCQRQCRPRLDAKESILYNTVLSQNHRKGYYGSSSFQKLRGARTSKSMHRRPLKGLHHDIPWYRQLIFGKPIEIEHQEQARLPKVIALPVFATDAISSVAYATQEILLALAIAGLSVSDHRALYRSLTLGLSLAIVSLLAIVVTSYWQTIFAYPQGGGSYTVTKENLGIMWALLAGAALLIDYILTVAVSVSAGVQNLLSTPLAHTIGIASNPLPVAIGTIAILTLVNLRGLKESGTLFAAFTYLFVGMAAVMIVLGIVGPAFGWRIYREAVVTQIPGGIAHNLQSFSFFDRAAIALKAFTHGCSAMTGTEAIANGVPAFRQPQSRNAAITLVLMGCILAFLFVGISYLATHLGVVYYELGRGHHAPPVIDQLSGAIFGKHESGFRLVLYYTMQVATAIILFLAATTAYADFPRLAYFMAEDRFLPRQLRNLGERLVYTNGIALLGLLATGLVFWSHASVNRLIPLYAVGVFTAFTLSQSGMVAHWLKLKGPGWQWRALINGCGAACTGIVLGTFIAEKFVEGAWIALIAGFVLIYVFGVIHGHYEEVRRNLTIIGWQPDPTPFANTVLVLIPSLHRGVFPALRYAQSLSSDCRALHIEIDPTETARLRREWEEYIGDDLPLVILPSLYRSLIAPLLVYLDEVQKERKNHVVTIVLPEFVSSRWWHSFLHNKNGLLLRYYLGKRPGVIVCNVRYFLDTSGGTTTFYPGIGTVVSEGSTE